MEAWKDSNGPGIYFPTEYNPVEKTDRCWMPEYHNIFFIALIVIKVVLVVIVINKACSIDSLDKHSLFYISIIAAVFSFCSDIYVWCRYRNKWKGVADKALEILPPKPKGNAQD